ncbi:MAG: hypothetical protein CVV44_16360 [Spirochaetae bacterium HGW-Spirochaetae-1]|nr:MAG: hypothetical protein CVV44_16360 [Spirochaetae bacterium HGW-Spirochaetae-1]
MKTMRFFPLFWVLFILSSFISCDMGAGDTDKEVRQRQSIATVADDGYEPPQNPFLADSPWPMSHRNPYCQASSPYPGPESAMYKKFGDYLPGMPGLITMAVSGKYVDGSRVIWGNNVTHVFKISAEGEIISFIDTQLKDSEGSAGLVERATSGAYTLVDCENIFYVPDFTRIVAYGDSVADDPLSEVEKKRHYEIPEEHLRGDDRIVGLVITWDGMLAWATNTGTVAVVSRNFDRAVYLHLGDGEEISNSIACDEKGGIYVVTGKMMYRVQWTGSELTINDSKGGWSANYETGNGQSGIRLGAGSGSTPTLMGTGRKDSFVVITDGQDLMHLVLFWRDKIPADWRQIPGTKDRRIAAQVPVTFGNPDAQISLSEQSVCVRGYGALVVNNLMKVDLGSQMLNILASGIPGIAPRGAEKFQWDPAARKLVSVWANREICLPNGIPAMSAATGLIYDVGYRFPFWTMEALDWETGEEVFHGVLGPTAIFNSGYAATEIGLDGYLFSGTVLGMVRVGEE